MRRFAYCNVLLLALQSLFLPTASSQNAFHDKNEADEANKFPTIQDSVDMARLSHLAYHFNHEDGTYCDTYSSEDGYNCEWYHHNTEVGTKVLLMTNPRKRFIVIVFAGTDDLRTSLEDANIARKPFGNNSTIELFDSEVLVHAGFDNAVFSHGLWEEIFNRVQLLSRRHPFYKLFTTGHSLGAANSILTATALAIKGYHVTSINFGCPQTGNKKWRDYFNSTSPLKGKLSIWRIVLGWDLVARLPDCFYHVGHTIQLWSEDHKRYDKYLPNLVEAYYQHYGNEEKGYASAPPGWYAKSHEWMPGAMLYHFIGKYVKALEGLAELDLWVDSFKALNPIGYDDDQYDEPPDDWYEAEWEVKHLQD
jgi:hypothetical protein